MEQQIVTYLTHRMPDATGIVVDGLARIAGGSSQETFKLHARWQRDGVVTDRWLILRREPPSGLVIAERDLEYKVYQALEGQGVPAPRVYFLELDSQWLDRPFFIMDMAPGRPGVPFNPAENYDGQEVQVARQFWTHLGTLAAIDHRAAGLTSLRNGNLDDDFWEHELTRWESILDAGETVIEPVVRAGIRWLRRNPPPAASKPAIVHGDYRSGNFLFTPDGNLSAILDWEMCHIGDPLEDIAWAIDPFWPMTRHLPLDEGLALWEQSSGLKVDRQALQWWQLFAAVKACAIWTTAEVGFTESASKEVVVAMSGLRAGHFHRNLILSLLTERGGAL